jgi:hypothetical protein
MDVLVAGDVNGAEVVLDFAEHVALGRAQGVGDLGVDAQRDLRVVLAVLRAGEPAGLFENLVADRLR